MAERFYVNCELMPGPVVVQGSEAHHLATVCRLRPGAAVCLFNGDGKQYTAHVVTVERRQVTLQVEGAEQPDRELPFPLVVAAPLPRGDRESFLIEKLTELGVSQFFPLQTARSVVHPRGAKLDRLQRQVIEASKQCGRNTLMAIEPLTSWTDLLARPDLSARRVFAHPGAATGPGGLAAEAATILAVGPEGGFTDDEVAQAQTMGWTAVDLGPRILRVETAAMALAVLAGCGRNMLR